MARPSRTQPCGREAATSRLAQAEAFLLAAELALDDITDTATPNVAASLAVLAGIGASDAACCARLGVRPRGQSHDEAVPLLATVRPHGTAMAKDLQRLLARKDTAQYGLTLVGAGEATKIVGWAQRLVAAARAAVAA